MSHTAKTPPVAKGSNGLPVNAVDGTQAYDTDKAQYVVSVSNAWQGVGGGGGFGTPTVLYDDGFAVGNTDQIQGDIPNYTLTSAPYGSIKGLVIGTSCTSIGSYAFGYLGDFDQGITMGSLVIPDSVTSIGDYAFSVSYFTGDLIFPDSVTSIGSSAFAAWNSVNLSFNGNMVIGSGVTSIGSNAFNEMGATALYINCPASSWTGLFALSGTTFTTIFTGPNATGYTASFQGRTGLTISPWANYPAIP